MTLSSQYKVKMKKTRPSRLSTRSLQSKIYDSLFSVQGQNEKRPSRLSTRSLQSKIYDPLISVQDQNEKKTTLSSQYKVSSNPKFTTLLSQYKVSIRYATLSSQYKVKMKKRPSGLSTRSLQSKIYDPLVLVQGQNEKK